MATAVATATDTPEPKKTSMVVQIGLLVVLSVMAIGGGWVAGSMLSPGQPANAPAKADDAHGKDAVEMGSAALAESLNVFLLEDITTNLAGQTDTWARLAVALVFAGPPDPAVAETVHQDFLAYLRTVKTHQVEGPSGFQHLRSDLEERAVLRSEGKIKRILIRTLLLE